MIWTAFSRKFGKIVSYVIGNEGIGNVITLYKEAKKAVGNIDHICTDANSCYEIAFKAYGVSEPHSMTKKETHYIEAVNSSMRDNLARLNRKSKRHSKSYEMLDATLTLFFASKCYNSTLLPLLSMEGNFWSG